MARYAHFFALALVSLLGCFSPEDPPVALEAGECAPDGDLCSVNGDCCRFDGSSRSGAGLCVNFDEVAECTGICYADRDCEAGCCGALVDTADYGVCSPCSAAPFVPGMSDSNACSQGVEFFCACGDALGVPCGADRALFDESCGSGNSPADTFTCWAAFTDQACADALDACS